MKKIYKRIKVNKELLKLDTNGSYKNIDFKQNQVNDTLPTGKVIGVYFNSYLCPNLSQATTVETIPTRDGREHSKATFDLVSHTDIVIKDSRGHLLTEPTDLRDFSHKSGGYNEGFKELDFNCQNERISIAWETLGNTPICGEFVFEIQAPDNC